MTTEMLTQTRTNPFPGLRPFEFDESHLFFGRDGQSEQVLRKLSATRFVAIVGTSGSGKSSLARAGLLPELYGGMMPSAGSNWRIAILRPGNNPIGNLALALNEETVFGSEHPDNARLQVTITEATLRRGSLGLIEAVRQAMLQPNENLLVLVDQFEEIFRFAKTAKDDAFKNEAAAFVKLLLEASRQRDVNIYVILTMRSDFLGDCALFRDLPETINEGQYLVPRLTRDQLREAITGPIAVAGADITPRLVDRLLNDIGDNQDQLPVLQHALMRVWDEWEDKRLVVDRKPHREVHQGKAIDLCCYEAVGGMAEALSRHADEAYDELPDARHRLIAEKIFKCLTEKGEDNREIRRPATLREICQITDCTEAEAITVIEAFCQEGRSFLNFVPSDKPLHAESLVDISHESLIRVWQKLKIWVNEEARSARIYYRLAETAVLHQQSEAGLWRDPDLSLALRWQEQQKPNRYWAERYDPEFDKAMNFLAQSQRERQREREELERQQAEDAERAKRELKQAQALAEAQEQRAEAERQRAEGQARYASRLRKLIVALTTVALLALASAVFAITAYRTADTERSQSEAARQMAVNMETKARVSESEAKRQRDQAESARDEAESARREAVTAEKAAEAAAIEAELQRRQAEVSRQNAEQLRAAAEKEQKRAEESESLANQFSYVAKVRLAQKSFEEGEYKDGFEEMKEVLSSQLPETLDFSWRYLWRTYNKARNFLVKAPEPIIASQFSSDGKYAVLSSEKAELQLWDLAGKRKIAEWVGHLGQYRTTVIWPDGKQVATGSADGKVTLWRSGHVQPLQSKSWDNCQIISLALSPNGTRLIVAMACYQKTEADSPKQLRLVRENLQGQVRILDVEHWADIGAVAVEKGRVITSLAFSEDGKWLACAGSDAGIGVVETQNWETRKRLAGQGTRTTAIAFAPTGQMLVSCNSGGEVKLWNVESQEKVRDWEFVTGAIYAAAFSPDGRNIVVGSDTGALTLLHTDNETARTKLGGHEGAVSSLLFSNDGQTLLSSGADGAIIAWVINGAANLNKEFLPVDEGVVWSSFLPQSANLVTVHEKRAIKIWDLQEQKLLASTKEQPDAPLFDVAELSPDGRILATGGGELELWEVNSQKELIAFKLEENASYETIEFSPDGSRIATAVREEDKDEEMIIKVWDAHRRQELWRIRRPSFTHMDFAADNESLVIIDEDGSLGLWRNGQQQKRTTIKLEKDETIITVDFSPDGSLMALRTNLNRMRICNSQRLEEVMRTPLRMRGDFSPIAISPDNKILAIGDGNGVVTLRDIITGEELASLRGQNGEVFWLGFSRDGKILAVEAGREDKKNLKLYLAASQEEIPPQ